MKKEVKIIGLKLNQQFGILQSCQVIFDQDNKLISVKGEVGSGKTSLQKSLQLGTLGSDTLKDDKELYGKVDQEVKLLDGKHSIYVGCKTNKKGNIDYVLYSKDSEGKKIKNPVIDGVELTPATYLKSLQTALTWRMEELTSENPTVQKKLLLEIYKKELAKIGVIFDKGSVEYENSILGRIDEAVNDRGQKEYERKKVGGFKNQLEPLGIDVDDESTWPTKVDISYIEQAIIKKQVEKENIDSDKENKLSALKNKGDNLLIELKKLDGECKEENEQLKKDFENNLIDFNLNRAKLSELVNHLNVMVEDSLFSNPLEVDKCIETLKSNFNNPKPKEIELYPTLEFNEEGKLLTKSSDWPNEGKFDILDLLRQLDQVRLDYKKESEREGGDTTEIDQSITDLKAEINLAARTNEKVEMLNSFLDWQKANNKVVELRNEYFNLLSSVDTGVKGLKINVDKEDEKMNIYLSYDGSYSPEYFGNPNQEQRKLSSYSGTQKPLICLLLQSYLLSKKDKALRYLWIDNVPIDKKTKTLLNDMGDKLGVTIMVNITGDFSKETLESGEILLEGGEIFFKEYFVK